MLQSVYYRGGWDALGIVRLRAKMAASLTNLLVCSLWAELREVDPAFVAVVAVQKRRAAGISSMGSCGRA
jgi:hypothetical protein